MVIEERGEMMRWVRVREMSSDDVMMMNDDE